MTKHDDGERVRSEDAQASIMYLTAIIQTLIKYAREDGATDTRLAQLADTAEYFTGRNALPEEVRADAMALIRDAATDERAALKGET